MNRLFALRTPLFNNEDMGGAPGGGAPTPSPSPSPSPAIPDNSAAAPAIPNANAPAAKPQVPDGYVPSYRIRETREQFERQQMQLQQQWQQREAQYQAQMEAIRRQLHAVVGVEPQNEEQQQLAAIQAQFKKVFPDLAAMNERAKDIMAMLESRTDYDSAMQYQWQSHGRNAMNRLFDLASKSLGHDLSDAAKARLHASFVGHVQSDPALLERYVHDPSLVDEFWQDFESNFIGPVRRSQGAQVAQAVTQRPRLPQDSPAPIAPIQAPAQPKDLDERVKGAWSAFNAVKQGQR